MSGEDVSVTWSDPPPHGNSLHDRSGRWAPVIKSLRENPEKWALLGDYGDASLVTAIKRGKRGFSPAGSFEARSALVEGKRRVFVRFVGEAVTSDA